jgi:predicted nucleic acid-binding protein
MARKEKIVIDASVVTKWFSKEKDTDKAVQFMEKHVDGRIELVVPTLLLYEVANALNYKPDFAEKDVKDSLNALVDLSLCVKSPTKEVLEKTVSIARRHELSIYDASYVALAESLNIKVVTADEKLWKKLEKHPLLISLGFALV